MCDSETSCDWTACYDDIEFTKAVLNDIRSKYCIDDSSIHMTGISNGGMFMYYTGKTSILQTSIWTSVYLYLIYRKIYILASELGNIVASIAPISGSPLLGFNHMPDTAMSVIDFHGTDDSVIPYDIYR